MLDIDLINSTITELENGETNFASCNKLASLYIIRNEFYKQDDAVDAKAYNIETVYPKSDVERELSDILPQYSTYCEIKQKYQLRETTKDHLLYAMDILCKEIKEFMTTLYSSTDMEEERDYLRSLVDDLSRAF